VIRIGSRGSALARWQAEYVAAQLRQRGHEVSIEILVTTGDRIQRVPFAQVGTKGMFTKEIEEALSANRIDLAVHSLKDLPTELADDFVIAGIPERADPRDAFISVKYASLSVLPPEAVVGTSSLRRQAQLRVMRSDLDVREMRGNVDTRLRKLQEGQYDAIVLAAAGLDRLQQTQWIRARFSPQEMCPAAGQGALAIECRVGDQATRSVVAALDHASTRFAVTVERTALATLEGGCHVPVGVHCETTNTGWLVTAIIARPDGSQTLREKISLENADNSFAIAQDTGWLIARRLLEQGGGDLLAASEGTPNPPQPPTRTAHA
jgi:hydroxymethylbilane synthase